MHHITEIIRLVCLFSVGRNCLCLLQPRVRYCQDTSAMLYAASDSKPISRTYAYESRGDDDDDDDDDRRDKLHCPRWGRRSGRKTNRAYVCLLPARRIRKYSCKSVSFRSQFSVTRHREPKRAVRRPVDTWHLGTMWTTCTNCVCERVP